MYFSCSSSYSVLKNHDISKDLKNIEARNQGFYSIFSEEGFKKEINEMKQFVSDKKNIYTDIVICGIGGSALGFIALYDSLGTSSIKFHVLENIDPDMMQQTEKKLDYKKTLFIVISKSGGTIETLSQYAYFTKRLAEQNLSIPQHMVIITGNSGYLREQVNKYHIPVFSVPENIGGRFSVLSPVALLPALFAGIDIDELLQGAEEIAENFQLLDTEKNLCFSLAEWQFSSQKPIQVLMPYSSRLRSFALWYAQLLAESTGKEGKGYTMLSAVGPTDQHSQLQLFAEGPTDKAIILMNIEHFNSDISFSADFLGTEKTFRFSDLLEAEFLGTLKSLQEKNIPVITLTLPCISAYEIGKVILLFEGATAFLGEFLEIDAFDQPGVERGKVLAKEILMQHNQ